MDIFIRSTVREVMRTDVAKIRPAAPLREALQTMYDSKLNSLVVELNEPSLGVGILTQKDLLGALFDGGEDLDATTVEELMTAPAITVSPNFSVGACMQTMRMIGVRRVIVVENDQTVGIVSLTDIFRRATESAL